MDLQPLIVMEGCQQQTELLLKFIQVGDGTVGQIRRFKDKAFGDITAAAQMIEQNQIADKETVGWTFKHKSDALGFSPLHVVHHLLDVVQGIHELLDGAHGFAFVDGDIGFADVRPCPFHVGAGGLAKAARGQTAAQGSFGGSELAEQRLPLAFNRLEFAGIHDCSEIQRSSFSSSRIVLSRSRTRISETHDSSSISGPRCCSA